MGTALCNNLKNIREGKNKTRPALNIEEIYEYDLNSTPEELNEYCRKADFVFNLAGVNRPENPEDFMKGNRLLVLPVPDEPPAEKPRTKPPAEHDR